MTIYEQLLAKAAERPHAGCDKESCPNLFHTDCGHKPLNCIRCDLKALAKQVCAEALTEFMKKHESDAHDIPVWDALDHVRRDIIGGPECATPSPTASGRGTNS